VTPLHTDPHHNLFVQILGRKYIQLYPPNATEFMYPFEQGLTTNSSQVDAQRPDLEKYPLFAKARGFQCVIAAGQAIYIPKGAILLVLMQYRKGLRATSIDGCISLCTAAQNDKMYPDAPGIAQTSRCDVIDGS
jgi:hypothetical protein